MGRSLAPIAAVAASQPYDRAHNDPFRAFGSVFHVDRKGDRVWHRETRLGPADEVIYEHADEVHYAIGSGVRGYSYLTDRGGYLFQTAGSWYSQKAVWDLSPGFRVLNTTSRPVDGQCLFCHANRVRFREDSLNHFEQPIFEGHSIGCERCHGPGEVHVREGGKRDRRTKADYTIVNPKRLDPAAREAVCQQCHLEGAVRVLHRGRHLADYRPGLPLSAFWSVFVYTDAAEEEHKSVNHVEQMYRSRCFRESRPGRKLGCTSCHDPHDGVGPDRRVAYYRDRCLRCHAEHGCAGPVAERRARADNCIACHMRRFPNADVAHSASTDHRILRRPARAGGRPGGAGPRALWPDLSATSFFADEVGARDAEVSRDLGIGLVRLMAAKALDPRITNARATGLLEAALRRDPADGAAREARAYTLLLAHNPRQALAAYEVALKLAPRREACLTGAAAAAAAAGEDRRAVDYWRRAVAANPWMAGYRAGLADALARRGAWEEARAACRAWWRLDPASVPARKLWITLLLRAGDRRQAAAEWQRVQALRPPDLDLLRAWYRGQSRARGGVN
jgi:tetratricopeptide (TPR) repeat protein